MTYEELKARLYHNLELLMEQCDKWFATVYEVAKYQDYITKVLQQYLQQHETDKQRTSL